MKQIYNLRPYEYIYFFMMIIYMAFMTPETRVMTGGLTTRTVAFFIPIILTVILLKRNKISFNTKYFIFLSILVLWSLVQIFVKSQYDLNDLANYFYIIYAYTMAYIHICVYRNKMFLLYKDIMIFFAKLSLALWLLTIIMPGLLSQMMRLFPSTIFGYNFFYLINLIDPYGKTAQITYGIVRNSGCAWEPGRYAIMLCLAILINLYYNKGITFRKNMWLLLALITTMSTTGYILCVILYVYFYIKKINLKYAIFAGFAVSFLMYFLWQLDFIGKKLEYKLDLSAQTDHIEESWQWTEQHNENQNKRAYHMDRIPSMFYEFQNFIHDPIIGYGANTSYSYFYKEYTAAIGFTGGLMQIFGQYGIILGLFFLYSLYKSSISISQIFNNKKIYGFLIYSIISMISYPIIWHALYTAFWFYGDLDSKIKKNYDNSSIINRAQ